MIRALALIVILMVVSPLAFTPDAYRDVYVSSQRASSEARSKESFSSSDPLQIFLYVRNNFIFEPYYGYMKGVNGTLSAGGGNDFDQASLLVHLLRRANVQARFVEGWITLDMGELENWLGVETSNATVRLLNQWGIIYQDRSEGGQTVVQLGHVWVQAYLSGAWIQMDPSFKQYTYHKSMTAPPPGLPPLPMPNGTSVGPYGVTKIDIKQIRSAINYIQEKSVQAIKDLKGTYPLAYRTIVSVHDFSAPSKSRAVRVYDEIPASKEYYIEVTIPSFDPSMNDFTFTHNVSARHPTPFLSESRVTFYFVPVDDQTLKYIQSFPNALEDERLDPGKVKMYPVLRFNSTRGIMGEAMPLGCFVPLKVRVLLGEEQVNSGYFGPQVGAWNSLVINTGDNLNDTILQDRAKQLKETLSTLDQRRINVDDVLGASLDIHGRIYFDLFNDQTLLLQNNFGIKAVHTIDVALTGFKYNRVQTRTGWHLEYAGPCIDYQIGGWRTVSPSNRASGLLYNLMWESMSSYLEGQVIQLLYHAGSVSTVTLLEAANDQGVLIFIIDKNNWDKVSPQLSLSKDLMRQLKEALDGGWSVIVPQHEVTTTAIAITLSQNSTPPLQARTYVGTPWIKFNVDPTKTVPVGWWGWVINSAGSSAPQSSPSTNGGASGVTWEETGPSIRLRWRPHGIPHEEYGISAPWPETPHEVIQDTWRIAILQPVRPGTGAVGGMWVVGLTVAAGWVSAVVFVTDAFGRIHQSTVTLSMSDPQLAQVASIMQGVQFAAQLLYTFPFVAFGAFTQESSHSPEALAPPPSEGLLILSERMGSVQHVEATPDAYYSQMLVATLDISFLERYSVDQFLAPLLEQSFILESTGGFSAPDVVMYLSDQEGHRTGFDPQTKETYLGINYLCVFGYSADTKSPQILGLWNLAAGNYSVVVSSSGDRDLELSLTADAYPPSSFQSRKEVPREATVMVPMTVSFNPNGALNVMFGDPVPVTFIRFQKTENGVVRGQLLDSHLQGLGGREVNFFYTPPLSFTGWTYIENAKASANGSFILNWNAVPPGESTVMVTCGNYFRAFTHLPVRFPVTVTIHDLKGEPLADRDVSITANNKTASSAMRGGSVTFEAYPGYNVIEVSPLVKTVVYTPVPCRAIAVQLNVREVTSTSSTMSSSMTPSSSTLAAADGLPNVTILATLAAAALLITGAIIIKRQRSKRTKEA